MSSKQKQLFISQGDEQGNTPLHMAALQGNLETIRILEKAGADPGVKNKSGEMPVDIAKYNENQEVVEYFS